MVKVKLGLMTQSDLSREPGVGRAVERPQHYRPACADTNCSWLVFTRSLQAPALLGKGLGLRGRGSVHASCSKKASWYISFVSFLIVLFKNRNSFPKIPNIDVFNMSSEGDKPSFMTIIVLIFLFIHFWVNLVWLKLHTYSCFLIRTKPYSQLFSINLSSWAIW